MNTVKEDTGREIRRARRAQGLSHDRLAERLGTTRQVVIGWEKGRYYPAAKFRPAIERELGVRVPEPESER